MADRMNDALNQDCGSHDWMEVDIEIQRQNLGKPNLSEKCLERFCDEGNHNRHVEVDTTCTAFSDTKSSYTSSSVVEVELVGPDRYLATDPDNHPED